MNYDKIEELLRDKSVSKMKFYDAVGLTSTGFSKMMRNQTITVETLEKIALYFGVQIGTFFGIDQSLVEIPTDYQKKYIECLEEKNALQKEISGLKDEIRNLEKTAVLPADSSVRKLESK